MLDEIKIHTLNKVADMLNLHPQILISVYTNLVNTEKKWADLPEQEQREIFKKIYNETYSLFSREYLTNFFFDDEFIDNFLKGGTNFDGENLKKVRKIYTQIMLDAFMVLGLMVLKIQ